MTARLTGIGVVVLACVATTVAGVQDPTPPSAPQQPAFRSTADLVSIEVAIRGRDLMRPLQPSDFELRDNNVRQTILSVESVTIPVDVSVIVDASGAVSGFGDSVPSPAAIGARLDEIVRDVRTVLRVGDAFRLVTVDTHVTEVLPLEQVGAKTVATAVGPVASDGLPSLNDALAIEMMRVVDPGRRHVVVVATPGVDSMSVVDLASLRELARRSEAIVDVVHADSLIGGTRCVDIPSEAIRPCAFARRRVWQPPRRDEMDQLSELASLTGGRFHPSDGLYVRPTAVGTVKDTVNDLRNGVVLRYTPRGVSRTGWHDVAVTLPGLPNLKVAGRRGYVIEPAVAASPGGMPTIAATTGSEGVDATLAPFVKAFDAGDYSGLQRQLRTARDLKRIIRDFVEGASPWPGSAHTEAVFALELANAGFGLRDDELDPDVAKLLQRFTRLVRQPIDADEFECAWLWTESAVLEGAMRPAVAEPLVIEAARRCPADPRLQLARAVIADQRWPLGRLDIAPAPPELLRQIAEVPPLYDAAMASPSVAVEARVRAAWFAYRAGNLDRALALIDAAGSGQADRHVLYLRALIRGHVLRALNRTDEAEAAYRTALEVWPGAQSSQVSLMTLWLGRGNRVAAESAAEAVQVAPAAQFDPWWMYWQGDYRAYDAIARRLREQKR